MADNIVLKTLDDVKNLIGDGYNDFMASDVGKKVSDTIKSGVNVVYDTEKGEFSIDDKVRALMSGETKDGDKKEAEKKEGEDHADGKADDTKGGIGGFFKNNWKGILGMLGGMLLLGPMLEMGMMGALLVGLIGFALGGFLGGEKNGLLGGLFGGGDKKENSEGAGVSPEAGVTTPGQTTEVGASTGTPAPSTTPAAGTGAAPTTPANAPAGSAAPAAPSAPEAPKGAAAENAGAPSVAKTPAKPAAPEEYIPSEEGSIKLRGDFTKLLGASAGFKVGDLSLTKRGNDVVVNAVVSTDANGNESLSRLAPGSVVIANAVGANQEINLQEVERQMSERYGLASKEPSIGTDKVSVLRDGKPVFYPMLNITVENDGRLTNVESSKGAAFTTRGDLRAASNKYEINELGVPDENGKIEKVALKTPVTVPVKGNTIDLADSETQAAFASLHTQAQTIAESKLSAKLTHRPELIITQTGGNATDDRVPVRGTYRFFKDGEVRRGEFDGFREGSSVTIQSANLKDKDGNVLADNLVTTPVEIKGLRFDKNGRAYETELAATDVMARSFQEVEASYFNNIPKGLAQLQLPKQETIRPAVQDASIAEGFKHDLDGTVRKAAEAANRILGG